MDLFTYYPRTDNSENLGSFKISDIANLAMF